MSNEFLITTKMLNNLDRITFNKLISPKSIQDTVDLVFLGYFSTGKSRKLNIERYTPYNYEDVQSEINKYYN